MVFIVDDDISVREALQSLVRSAGWQPETFANGNDFLARSRVSAPSCVLLDLSLPDLNGLDLQKRIASEGNDMPIIFITGYGDVQTTVRAMKAGATEFLTKPLDEDVLLDSIHRAIEQSTASLARAAVVQTLRNRHATLTPREREVMALVVSGLLNKQIGFELGISEITVKAHRGKVMTKMAAASLPELVTMADRLRSESASPAAADQRFW